MTRHSNYMGYMDSLTKKAELLVIRTEARKACLVRMNEAMDRTAAVGGAWGTKAPEASELSVNGQDIPLAPAEGLDEGATEPETLQEDVPQEPETGTGEPETGTGEPAGAAAGAPAQQ